MELLRSQFIKMYTFHLQITSWEKKKEYMGEYLCSASRYLIQMSNSNLTFYFSLTKYVITAMCLCMAKDFLLRFIKTLGNPPSYFFLYFLFAGLNQKQRK